MYYPPYDAAACDFLLRQALTEDIGRGDITSQLILDKDAQAEFVIANRSPLIVCGLTIAIHIFNHVDMNVKTFNHQQDGKAVEPGQTLISGSGNALSILAAERVALNIMQHLSGISTLTHHYVEQVKGTKARILDTRKTLPGLRGLQKYAVRMGGGYNHRLRLDDGVLIKDNHISVCGSITEAVKRARSGTPFLTKIEVECDTLAQVEEAASVQVDVIMLDNMPLSELRQAVALVNGRALVEASGNVSLETIRDIAETGVDYISVGKLTHSAPSADIGLDIVMH